jgi:hypothetical protein
MASRAVLLLVLLGAFTATAAEPAWLPIGAQASVVTTAVGQTSAGGELTLVLTTSAPTPRAHDDGTLEGWRVQPGVQLGAAGVGGAYCGSQAFCATRLFAGPSVRVGWLRGFPIGASGVFAQLDVLGARAWSQSAPLSPAIDAYELLTRLRLGGQWAPPSRHHDGWTFFLSVVVEARPLPGVTRGLGLGVSLGVGL